MVKRFLSRNLFKSGRAIKPAANRMDVASEQKERPKVSNLRELIESGYEVLSVREEMRKNLIEKIKSGAELFPGLLLTSSMTRFPPSLAVISMTIPTGPSAKAVVIRSKGLEIRWR